MRHVRVGALLGGLLLLAAPAQALPKTDNVQELIGQVLRGPSVAADRAAEKLRFLGPEKSGPPLRALMASPDPHTRAAVSQALVIVRDPGAVKLLQKAIVEDESWEVRRNAANGLGVMKATGATSAIEKALRKDSKTVVRTACIRALDRLGTGAKSLAEVSVSDPSLELRLASLDALAHQKAKSARGRIRPLLSDGSELVRFAAARTLAWQEDPEAQKFLDRALASPDSSVADRAVRAASDVPTKWAVALFVRGMTHPDLGVQVNAARELTKRKDERGTRFLAKVAMLSGPEADSARSMLDSVGITAEERARLAGSQ